MLCYGNFSPVVALVSIKSILKWLTFTGDINESYIPKVRKWDNYKIWTVNCMLIILFISSLFSHLINWVHQIIINVVFPMQAKECNISFTLAEKKATPNPVIKESTGALPSLCSNVSLPSLFSSSPFSLFAFFPLPLPFLSPPFLPLSILFQLTVWLGTNVHCLSSICSQNGYLRGGVRSPCLSFSWGKGHSWLPRGGADTAAGLCPSFRVGCLLDLTLG